MNWMYQIISFCVCGGIGYVCANCCKTQAPKKKKIMRAEEQHIALKTTFMLDIIKHAKHSHPWVFIYCSLKGLISLKHINIITLLWVHRLLLLRCCKVLLYWGRSCCIEVVDRQTFALSYASFCELRELFRRDRHRTWMTAADGYWVRLAASMNPHASTGLTLCANGTFKGNLANSWLRQRCSFTEFSLPRLLLSTGCVLVKIRVIEVFSTVSAVVSLARGRGKG